MRTADVGGVLVVIPTYNERENLEWIVGRVRTAVPEADVLVVDDSSPDGTGEIADKLADADDQVSVLHRTEKAGLGAAYLHGFRIALERGYDVVGEMDADGSHQPEQLPSLLSALADADLVIGSRWVPGGSVVNWPLRRKVLSVGGNFYARILLGIPRATSPLATGCTGEARWSESTSTVWNPLATSSRPTSRSARSGPAWGSSRDPSHSSSGSAVSPR